jgi:WXXGXW repeat (2 copies)
VNLSSNSGNPSKVFSRFLLYGARPGGNTMKQTSKTQTFSTKRVWLMRSAAALLAATAALAALPQKAHAGVFIGVGISVGFPPPVLPVYVQPPMPEVGYIWTPGYWAWNGAAYYWVPGTWVMPPAYGLLWTPGYWGWVGGVYAFHAGYWGPHVGFYGGVNYGYGYGGVGYSGGHWGRGGFYYNRSVNQFGGVHVTNVYNQTVVNNTYINRTSYNGGQGGLAARATPQEEAFAHEQHVGPVAAQEQQMHMASQNRAMLASVNHGAPPIAATSRPGAFTGGGVVGARGVPAASVAAAGAGRFTPAGANAAALHPTANGAAMRSANFAPHATPGANTAMRSANYAPHAAPTANTAMRSANYAPHTTSNGGYHPASVSHTAYTPSHASQTAYHPQAGSYHPAAPQYHAAAQHAAPQYHAQAAPRSAPAPRSNGGGGNHHDHG